MSFTQEENQNNDRASGRAIVIIPARGGSKRFPRKNIATLAGRPLLSYSVAAAAQAATIDGVFVSTEDDEIAQIAESNGADVPYRRPDSLAGDNVTNDDVMVHMVQHLQEHRGSDISIVVLIQPTSPFVMPEHIDAAVTKLRSEENLDSVTTMTEVDHRGHPYNLSLLDDDGTWRFMFAEERANASTRQAKPTVLSFGNLFAVTTDNLFKSGRFGPRKGAVLIDPIHAWDIDYALDLELAEYMIERGLVDLSTHIQIG
jgi:CMP-N,N'-diacetyllegionaminic acid synthase